MADPLPFVPGYSYTDRQEADPLGPQPGPQLDNDFADVARSIATLKASVQDVRRSDGRLKNGSVGLETLSDKVRSQLGAAPGAPLPTVTVGTAQDLREYYGAGVTLMDGSQILVREMNALYYYDGNDLSSLEGSTVIVDNQGRRWKAVGSINYSLGDLDGGLWSDAGDGTGDLDGGLWA